MKGTKDANGAERAFDIATKEWQCQTLTLSTSIYYLYSKGKGI